MRAPPETTPPDATTQEEAPNLPNPRPLTAGAILRFYLPLVLTSQLMTISGPIINFGIGRSFDPTQEFAAYWLGFGILLFLESPVLATQQAAATLAGGLQSLRRMLLVALLGAGVALVPILLVALSGLGGWVFRDMVPTTPRVAEIARDVLLIQAPIPILIAIRGVANGLAIRDRATDLIARATLIRMTVLAAVVGASVLMATDSGARAGAAALTAGIFFELLTMLWGTRNLVRRRLRERAHDAGLSYGRIARVAVPLVVSGIAWTGLRPLLNAILGTLPDPELAQAGFGVVLPLILITTSPLWIMQNVGLVLPRDERDFRLVLRFTAWTTLVFTSVVALMNIEPIRGIMLQKGFGLDPRLEAEVAPALLLLLLEPLALAGRSSAQGLLLRAHRAESLLYLSPVKIALVGVIGFWIAERHPDVSGTMLATALWVGSDIFDALVFGGIARSLIRGGLFRSSG